MMPNGGGQGTAAGHPHAAGDGMPSPVLIIIAAVCVALACLTACIWGQRCRNVKKANSKGISMRDQIQKESKERYWKEKQQKLLDDQVDTFPMPPPPGSGGSQRNLQES